MKKKPKGIFNYMYNVDWIFLITWGIIFLFIFNWICDKLNDK